MKRETLFWVVIMVLGAAGLIYQTAFSPHGMAKQFVVAAPVAEGKAPPARVRYVAATYQDFVDKKPGVRLSLPRTIGVWVSAFFTLAIFSFLYRDNPFYKLTEAIFIGISAAYWMIIGFWSTIIPNLVAKLWPDFTRAYFMPDLNAQPEAFHQIHYVPLVLALMLFCRLIPGIGWISRWPLAFVVGTTAGLKLLGFLQADFLQQIVNTMMPLVVIKDNASVPQNIWDSTKNIVTVIGVVSGLVYFLFTVEHRGPIEKISKVGVWVMMITFGAAFGYTVMGRIALLAARLEFLFDDWLWLIDPLSKRVVGS